MAATTAQKTRSGRRNYGKNRNRGLKGEDRAARALRAQGYIVKRASPQGFAGFADLIATKNGKTKPIQVKTISSRRLLTQEAAENRIRGKPFNVRIPAGGEVWVYDMDGRLHIIRGRS